MNLALLEECFGNCKFSETSKCLTKSSYEPIRLDKFHVFDEKGTQPVRVVKADEEYQLTVLNSQEKSLTLVKTDKCLFTDDHKKCDCIIYDEEKIFLIEIKTANKGCKSSARRKAVEQLSETINILKAKGVKFENYSSKAVICFKEGKPRPTQPSQNTSRAIFWENHRIELDEGSEIVF